MPCLFLYVLHKVKVSIKKRKTPKNKKYPKFKFQFLGERCVLFISKVVIYYSDTDPTYLIGDLVTPSHERNLENNNILHH